METNEVNPTAFSEAPTTIPGVLAAPVQATLDRDSQVPVTLAVTSVGTGAGIALHNRRFRVVQAPAHGHLDRVVGETFGVTATGAATVRYTPDPGFRGTDSFKYVAKHMQRARNTACSTRRSIAGTARPRTTLCDDGLRRARLRRDFAHRFPHRRRRHVRASSSTRSTRCLGRWRSTSGRRRRTTGRSPICSRG